MSSEKQDQATSSRRSVGQNQHVRKIFIYAAVLLFAFLLGLVPMWLKARSCARERDAAQASLRSSTLLNGLASAAIDARRGEYEPARQAASEFFTSLQIEIARGQDSAFTEAQQKTLRPLFDNRDDTITLLARSDPASADRLVDIYVKCRQALGDKPQEL